MSNHTQNERTVVNPLIKDKATFLETAADTHGKRTLIHIELAAGGGNDLHYHKTFDETFRVLEGQLGVQIGKKIMYLAKGESATVKAGELHRFFNASNDTPVAFNVLLEPGHAGFERTIQVAYGLAADGLTNKDSVPKNLYHLALLFKWGDTNVPGIFSLIEPVMGWLANRAVKKGIEKELVSKYCRF